MAMHPLDKHNTAVAAANDLALHEFGEDEFNNMVIGSDCHKFWVDAYDMFLDSLNQQEKS
jgi:hypothetical protein